MSATAATGAHTVLAQPYTIHATVATMALFSSKIAIS